MGKKSKRVIYVYIYVTDSLCCMAEANKTLHINYTPTKIKLKKQQKVHITSFTRENFDSG